ncbi:MAG: pilus assembly PilX N-terminal domain-containing protein [Parcubacteria group bacterium]
MNKKGFATIFVVILVLAIMSGIGIALLNFVLGEQKILRNEVKSLQAYYSAEAGAEDVLLRLKKAMDWTTPYLLDVGSSSVTVDVSDIVGGTRVINSVGNVSGRVRKVQIVYAISSDLISFHYGAQVGDGGMVMGNGSKVIGNVYSNGNVTGGGTITNSVIVAGNGNKIQGIDVGEDATVHTCESADITGTLYYVSGGSHGSCSYGAAVDIGPNEIESIPLPISLAQINEWKADALAGGTIADNVVINGNQTMGPIQIGTPVAPKNLTIGNGDTLKLYGTIYVTGDIVLSQNSAVLLENSYGSLSGIIIADGTIMVENGTQLNGSGQPGSYILILSTKNDIVNPVIDVRNNAAGAIFYTSSGLIFLKNNMEAREVTGYKIQLENNAEIQYESGLESAVFSEGPGGSWEIADWKETE